eukprot:TRINITY_DN4113_c0_g2_i8.p1 TRINITY_DN4113_c0_g2~~TRINITY_DN4113_c0_g2_i8.p1  ORF type:complete len:239 (+),score=36.56 TRINITY_DN4113_c0_g2_i8:411-1127(+)
MWIGLKFQKTILKLMTSTYEMHGIFVIFCQVLAQVDLAQFCYSRSIHCTLLSSGYIYNYDEVHRVGGIGFKEEDNPTYEGLVYSKLRIEMEKQLKPYTNAKKILLLRFNMPASKEFHPGNLLNKCIHFTKVHSRPISITVLDDMCPILLTLTESHIGGVLNFTNPGYISFVEILELYNRIFQKSTTFEIVPVPMGRPFCFLDTSKLEKTIFPQVIPNISESIEKIFLEWYSNPDHLLK